MLIALAGSVLGVGDKADVMHWRHGLHGHAGDRHRFRVALAVNIRALQPPSDVTTARNDVTDVRENC